MCFILYTGVVSVLRTLWSTQEVFLVYAEKALPPLLSTLLGSSPLHILCRIISLSQGGLSYGSQLVGTIQRNWKHMGSCKHGAVSSV